MAIRMLEEGPARAPLSRFEKCNEEAGIYRLLNTPYRYRIVPGRLPTELRENAAAYRQLSARQIARREQQIRIDRAYVDSFVEELDEYGGLAIDERDFMPAEEAAGWLQVSRPRIFQLVKQNGWPTRTRRGKTEVSVRHVMSWEPKKPGRPRKDLPLTTASSLELYPGGRSSRGRP